MDLSDLLRLWALQHVAWSAPGSRLVHRGIGAQQHRVLQVFWGLRDYTALFWQVWEQKPAKSFRIQLLAPLAADVSITSLTFKHRPDDLEDSVQVGLDLFDCLLQQPAIRSNADVRHPINRHQGLYQPTQRVEGCVTGLKVKKESLLV